MRRQPLVSIGFGLLMAVNALATTTPGWRMLAPLPDPVGYGGLFAAVLGDEVIAGGGSQFREKPNWLNGKKSYTDRLFRLGKLDGAWSEMRSRLPKPYGHFVAAATADAIYLAGGLDDSGALADVWVGRRAAGEMEFSRLPSLPKPVTYGTGALVNGRLYVVGGLNDANQREVSAEMWSLGIGEAPATWRRERDYPGTPVFVAAAAASEGALHVFGGISYIDGKSRPSAEAWRFDLRAQQWERLPDLPEARVGASAVVLPGRIALIGGYAAVFPGPAREHPGFSAQTYDFDPVRRAWSNGSVLPRTPVSERDSPSDPGPAPMIGAASVVWRGHVVIIGGEVRASVRTPAVLALPVAAGPRKDRL